MQGRMPDAERNQLQAEVAAPRDDVWYALAGELGLRGSHVEVLIQDPPAHLRLLLRTRPGEVQTLDYRLEALAEDQTLVVATISTSGPLHWLKRLLSFGRIDDAYLDGVAVGLANLQRHLEPPEREGDAPPAS